MITKPRNKYLLWNGKIQLANYPQPILKKDMVGFIKINVGSPPPIKWCVAGI